MSKVASRRPHPSLLEQKPVNSVVLHFANEGESKGPSSTPLLPDDRLWSFRAALSLWPSCTPEGSREHCEDRHPGIASD